MSTEPISGDENDAEVIPLPVAAGTLENAPAPPAPAAEGNRRPIIPQSLRPPNLRGTVGQAAGLVLQEDRSLLGDFHPSSSR